jgi:20S proteasome alpha/beta subunit
MGRKFQEKYATKKIREGTVIAFKLRKKGVVVAACPLSHALLS